MPKRSFYDDLTVEQFSLLMGGSQLGPAREQFIVHPVYGEQV